MRNKAFELVRMAIEELNEDLDYESLQEVADDTPLFGGVDGIDSLSLVSLIVDLEKEVEHTLGKRVTLADERAMSMRNSPYRTAGALADFIVARIEEADA